MNRPITRKQNRRTSRTLAHACRGSLGLERLEDRTLLSTYAVTNTLDDGSSGSLRWAIDQANANPGADLITFQLNDPADHVIQLADGLTVLDAVTIAGPVDPADGTNPLVWLDGSGIGGDVAGLTLASNGSTIAGLGFTNCFTAAIDVRGSGNTIGDASAVRNVLVGNQDGIVVEPTAGQTLIQRNLISANFVSGIHVDGATGVTIQHNLIGIDYFVDPANPTATPAPSGNFAFGVYVTNTTAADSVLIDQNVVAANFGDGIRLEGAAGVRITGNLIGTDPNGLSSGSDAYGNGIGVHIVGGSHDNEVGGSAAADRNVIAGSQSDGVLVESSSGNQVIRNYIGIDANGTAGDGTFSNQLDGVEITDWTMTVNGRVPGVSTDNLIVGNVLSNNVVSGVSVSASGNVVQGNRIGTTPDGLHALSNAGDGVHIAGDDNVVGGTAPGEGNLIAHNGGSGVGIESGTGNSVRGNSIYANAISGNPSAGIDLFERIDLVTTLNAGPTPNDSAGHTGTNLYQNAPVITLAQSQGSVAQVGGTLHAAPGHVYLIDVYATRSDDLSGQGDGDLFLGTVSVTTDANGDAFFTLNRAAIDPAYAVVTATATDAQGNTSEFSGALAIAFLAEPSQAVTTTTLTSSANPSVVGQAVTLTATVSGDSVGTPTGIVTFTDGTNPLGTAPLVNGVATLILSNLTVGGHSIVASYAGDTDFFGSTSAPLAQVVSKAASTVTLSSSINPSIAGRNVTFTANVSVDAPGVASLAGGEVLFWDGQNLLGAAPVNAGGSASLNVTFDHAGGHHITATFGGTDNVATGESAPVDQVVNAAPTTTTLTSSVSTSNYGQAVTFTAHVVDPDGLTTPTGTVTFTDGQNPLGTVNLVNGTATLTLSTLSTGGHSIVAGYGGSNDDLPSASAPLTQTVNPAATATTLVSSANPANVGQAVTFTASVSSGAGTPGGVVTFMDGQTVLGTANLVNGVASLTVSTLSAGNHTITASYGGAGNYAASTSAPLTQVVNALSPGRLSGYVYKDGNNDGVKQSGEQGIGNVQVTLKNASGAVVATATTDCSGAYTFANVTPGTYSLVEIQPAHYVDGIETAGSLGGDASGDNNTISSIAVGSSQNGTNYNFGELPETFVCSGETATIGFWQNKNGQALIKSFNGGASSKALGGWLADNFPHLYGGGSPNSTAGKTNADVAALFVRLFNVSGQKLDAQVLGVALAVYSTTSSLGGTAAARYGFTVDAIGTGHRLFNIGSNGAAFGVANNTNMEVLDILSAADARTVNGVLYGGDTTLRNMANNVFNGINQQGDI